MYSVGLIPSFMNSVSTGRPRWYSVCWCSSDLSFYIHEPVDICFSDQPESLHPPSYWFFHSLLRLLGPDPASQPSLASIMYRPCRGLALITIVQRISPKQWAVNKMVSLGWSFHFAQVNFHSSPHFNAFFFGSHQSNGFNSIRSQSDIIIFY